MKLKDSLPLFIFEMANNHSGDVEHGIRIIREMKEVSDEFDFKVAFKLQYRDLDTFIHPDYKNRSDIKYIKRFSETRLSQEEFKTLKDEITACGFISICTPFDENSVDLIDKHGYDVIKIGSCSFTDWPLLERIVLSDKPIIASTASASLEEIDRVVSFFEHRGKDFALMHCVGAYPTARENLQLNQIDLLKNRYPEVSIGFSTHEEPDNLDSVRMAIAKGAGIFERHVAVPTDKYGINAYSSTPAQVRNWLASAADAYKICGTEEGRYEISEKEYNDLRGLKRGVFASANLYPGEKIKSENTFLAIPNNEDQLIANDLAKYTEYTAKTDIKDNQAVSYSELESKNLREKVLSIIKKIKAIIVESRIALPNKIDLELSHHYGIDKFEEWGAAILNCINREYCKKIIIILPGQNHPDHHHVKKEETFQVLYGDMKVKMEEEEIQLKAGEMITVERGRKHSFSSDTGCVFEEVSTTHFKNDSFYEDPEVAGNQERKTQMTFWSEWLYENLK